MTTSDTEVLVPTPRGSALLLLSRPRGPRALVVLGHGAGGDHTAPVLQAVRAALVADGHAVALLVQPYRVAGRRVPDRPDLLDAAALCAVASLRSRHSLRDLALVVGGKSSGARVACRTASAAGAVGVVALGFPLVPPGRPDKSRAAELLLAGCPVLVVQGERDAFGGPAEIQAAVPADAAVSVHAVMAGDHSYGARRSDPRSTKDCLAEVATTVVAWVGQLAAT